MCEDTKDISTNIGTLPENLKAYMAQIVKTLRDSKYDVEFVTNTKTMDDILKSRKD